MIESKYTASIHKCLNKRDVYHWKINASFQNGVPDAYYSGSKGDLWIEYKYEKNPPARAVTIKLSPLQVRWLNARYDEGRNVCVVFGTPNGSVILTDKQWNEPLTKTFFDQFKQTKKEIADWITRTVAR